MLKNFEERIDYSFHSIFNYLFFLQNFDDKHLICEKNTSFNAFNNSDVYASYRIRTFENPKDLVG